MPVIAPAPAVIVRLAPNGTIALRCPFADRDRAKSVAGWHWHKASKTWRYPATADTLRSLRTAFPGALVDPAVLEVIRGAEVRQREIDRIKVGSASDNSWPVRLPLYEHQCRAASLALAAPAFGFWMEQGTGKTAAAIAAAGRRFLDEEILHCLVVCPKSVMPVWASEFARFADFPYTLSVLDGPVSDRESTLQFSGGHGLRVAVVNYEATWRMEDALRRFVQGQMIVADECHRIKTPSAKQAKAMHRLGRAATYRLALTGTPITQSPLDLYSEYKFLDPTIFGPSYYTFRNRYAVMGGYGGHEVINYQNLDELTDKAYRIAYRVTRAECLDLPPELSQTIPVTLSPRTRSLYDELRRNAVATLEGQATVTTVNVLAEILRLQQITGGHIGTDEGETLSVGSEKHDACLDLLRDLLSDERRKVVVFCRFRAEIGCLAAALNEVRDGLTGVLDGQTRERGELVRRFQEDQLPRVLVVQVQTGGLGITLHRADTAVFFSTGWSLADYEQAKARIQRAGQAAERVQYIHLAASGTIDETIYRALAEKRDLAVAVTEGWRTVLEG